MAKKEVHQKPSHVDVGICWALRLSVVRERRTPLAHIPATPQPGMARADPRTTSKALTVSCSFASVLNSAERFARARKKRAGMRAFSFNSQGISGCALRGIR